MKKFLALAVTLTLFISGFSSLSVVARADNQNQFTYDKATKTLTVHSVGLNYENGTLYYPWQSLSSQTEKIIIKNTVTGIPNNCFVNFSALKQVEIPNTVTEISAFSFFGCTSLKSIKIPDSVKKINAFAFIGCTALNQITLPDTDIYVGAYSFSGSEYYNTAANWSSGVLYIGNHLIDIKEDVKTVTVKGGTKTVAEMAFANKTNLKSVTFSEGLFSINGGAFVDCSSLEFVTLPSSLKSIEYSAFFNCKSLKELKIPNTVSFIGDGAFENCSNLKLIVKFGSYAEKYAKNNNISYTYDCAHNNSERRGAVPATCTANGKTGDLYCFDCGGIVEKSTTILAAHKFGESTIIKEPTCTEKGIESGKCTVCGQESKNMIEPLFHDFGEWKAVSAVSCVDNGLDERKCIYCGEVQQMNFPAYGHKFGDAVITKKPTDTAEGVMESTCLNCGRKKQETIPKLGTSSKPNTVSGPTSVTAPAQITTQIQDNNGISQKATLTLNPLGSDSEIYKKTETKLKTISESFLLFEIIAKIGDRQIDIDLPKAISFDMDIPSGFNEDLTIYYVDDNGTLEKIRTELSDDKKKITLHVKKSGNYAVCSSIPINEAATEILDKEIKDIGKSFFENNKIIFISVGGALAAVILFFGILFLCQKKKSIEAPEDEEQSTDL